MGKRTTRFYDGYPVTINNGRYERITINDERIYLHIYIWKKFNGEYDVSKFDIHHINEIVTDNRLENLEILSKIDHHRLHHGWKRENGVWVAKPCYICHEVLSLDLFNVRHGNSYRGACRKCESVVSRKYMTNNPDKVKEYGKSNYKKNKGKYIERGKKRYELKKEEIKAYAKQYKNEHKEQYAEYIKKSKERKKLEKLNAAQTTPDT